jgi:hypothetical protein
VAGEAAGVRIGARIVFARPGIARQLGATGPGGPTQARAGRAYGLPSLEMVTVVPSNFVRLTVKGSL